jgi:hypothetical protein
MKKSIKTVNEGNRIFVSSTVYDLIDVRAEIEYLLRDLGFIPVMSDSKNDGFDSSIQSNSIETCLVNLRNCSAVIVITSQRYGPSLGDHGFSDHSATHLEYLEAKNKGIPIYFYARDKLMGEFSIWKKTKKEPPTSYPWIKKEQTKIFELLEDRVKLGDKPNWISVFSDSVDLKMQIRRDLKAWSDSITFWDDFEKNMVPIFHPHHNCEQVNSTFQWKLKQRIKNCGQTHAFNVTMTDISSGQQETCIAIPSGEAFTRILLIDASGPINKTGDIRFEYQDMKERDYQDIYHYTIRGGPQGLITGLKLKERKYLDINGNPRIRQ